MADEYLYSFERLCELLEHSDPRVCRWAIKRLGDCYPARMPDSIAPVFQHVDEYVIPTMCRLLGERGDLAVHGPQLREQLTKLPFGIDFAGVIRACHMLKDTEALTVIMNRLQNSKDALDLNGALDLSMMLIEMAPERARAELHNWVTNQLKDSERVDILVKDYLKVAELESVRKQIGSRRRVRTRWGREANGLHCVTSILGVSSLVYDIKRKDLDASEIQGVAASHAYDVDQLPQSFWNGIDLKSGINSIPSLCLEHFRILAGERDWALGDWEFAWNQLAPLTPFQKQVVLSKAVLEELVKPWPQGGEDALDEAVICLAILISLGTARDDATFIENAEDRRQAIEELVRSPREKLYVEPTPLCLEVGLDFVPVLRDLVTCRDPKHYFAILRAVECIPEFEVRWPGSCADLAGPIIDLLESNLGDSMNESAGSALIAIGPAALDELIPATFNKHVVRLYLRDALARIPTARSVQAFLEANLTLDEVTVSNLADLCSPVFLPLLEDEDESAEIARTLCLICQVNGLDHSSYPRWMETIRNDDEKRKNFRDTFVALANKSTPKTNRKTPTKPKLSRKARKAAEARKKRSRKRKKK